MIAGNRDFVVTKREGERERDNSTLKEDKQTNPPACMSGAAATLFTNHYPNY